MTEIVPEGWFTKTLEDLVSLQYGKSPKDVISSEGKYPVIGTGGITGYATSYLFNGNTTVIGRKGTIDKPSYVTGKFWAIDTTYFATNYTDADPKWFYYVLNALDLSKYNEASGVPSLSRDTLYTIPLPTPTLPEQQKIAAILSSVDDVIDKTRAQINKLKNLKTGMMQDLLTKGIWHTEFKDSPLGIIPENWCFCDLSALVNAIIDCEHKTAPYIERSEYLVVRTSNIRDGELVFDDMKFTTSEAYRLWTQRTIPQYGDILFTREAPAGESCMVPKTMKICMGQRMVLLRPNKKRVLPEFLSLFLNSELSKSAIYDLSIGTTVTRINIEDIKKIPCLLPPLEEQKKINEYVKSITQALLRKRLKLNCLEITKKGLMQDLLTGKVRVKINNKEAAAA